MTTMMKRAFAGLFTSFERPVVSRPVRVVVPEAAAGVCVQNIRVGKDSQLAAPGLFDARLLNQVSDLQMDRMPPGTWFTIDFAEPPRLEGFDLTAFFEDGAILPAPRRRLLLPVHGEDVPPRATGRWMLRSQVVGRLRELVTLHELAPRIGVDWSGPQNSVVRPGEVFELGIRNKGPGPASSTGMVLTLDVLE